MLKALARISVISPLIFHVLLTVQLYSDDARASDTPAFGWGTISFPFDDRIQQAVLFDSANGWVSCGSFIDSRLYRLKNGIWQIAPARKEINISYLAALSPENMWFICYNRNNYRYFIINENCDKTIDYYTPNSDPILQLEFLSPENIWAVSQWGQIIHFDGTSWQLVPCPTFAHVTNFSMANDSCGWAYGNYRDKGFLLYWNGRDWQIKMQQKNFSVSVLTVNDTLGYGFLNNDSCIIRLSRDQCELVRLSSLIQDTVVATWQDEPCPVFFHDKGIAKSGGGGAHVTFKNRQRDIIWFVTSFEKSHEKKMFLLMHDGKVKYVHRQLPQVSNLYLQYVGNIFPAATQEYGIAFGDIDGDGDDDIYSINTSDRNRLLLFNGNQQIKIKDFFVEGAEHLNLLGQNRAKSDETIYDMGATYADIDNDGDRDLYITSMYEKNFLYENIANRTFRNIAIKAGASGGISRSQVGIWGDVDNDGDVDLFVTNEDTTNMLFLNNGFGKFKAITHLAGLTSQRGGKGATFGDLDGDGDLDLIVPNFNIRNRVYRNEGIHPQTKLPFFRDVTDLWLSPEPDSLAKSTAACLADIDNDGDLDLYICNLVASNRLYENDGTGHFTDITESAGLLDSCLTSSACFFDANNDGDLDLFLSNRGPNLFFKNMGDKKFIKDETSFKLEESCYSNGVACGDPDGDGDIDIYVANNDAESIYYGNQLDNKNYLEIKLIGTKSNRDAIGAKAFLYENGYLDQPEHLLGMREVNGGYGYGCMNSTTIHFGVPKEKNYDLRIWFPSGVEVSRTNLSPGQLLTIEEQTGWAKSLALCQRAIMRQLKSQRNQIEFFKFIGLMIILTAASLVLNWKKWIAIRSPFYLPIYPLGLYLVLVFITKDINFWVALLLPLMFAIISFAGLAWLQKQQVAQASRERLAEELLLSCKAFDHGSWAASCLNQLQLFSVNLPAKQPISEKVGKQLNETILNFYQLVFKELGHIHQLALSASIQVQHATELERQRLTLSSNLEKTKVALALKKGVAAEIWKNIYSQVELIKVNVNEINFGASRLFTCDAAAIIRRALSSSEKETELHLIFAASELQQQELWVCIKPSELAAILDNLLQNAQRAMIEQPKPKIIIKLSQTDRHLFIEFSDNGCGIPKKLWDEIFEESYSTKSESKGGFGLFYSRRTLEKYGGSIEVTKSIRNKGTTFLIKLRRA